ncbi:MAG: hypothetical protein GKR93_12100 [Gammaproteobacteria bacterium]|nr:hypothetical protein [Gammaproteobacteria bacterium]
MAGLVSIQAEYLHDTSSAICFRTPLFFNCWLPLSMIEVDGELEKIKHKETITIRGPRWYFKKKGLLKEEEHGEI